MTLYGTLLFEEIMREKEHLHAHYEDLFPSLCNVNPDISSQELYTSEQLLSGEIWYSSSMNIMFPSGKLRTCLVHIDGFLI